MNHKYTLKKNHEINDLLQKHQSVGNKYYAVYYEVNESTKIAISVSKKLGKAFFRNYQKRVLREIIRINIDKFSNMSLLIVVKNNSINLTYEEKEKELLKLIDKIRR